MIMYMDWDYLVPRVWFHQMQDYLNWGTKHHVKYYYAELYPKLGRRPESLDHRQIIMEPQPKCRLLVESLVPRVCGRKSWPDN